MAKPTRLTDAIVKRLSAPAKGSKLTRDTAVKGFALIEALGRGLVAQQQTD